MSLLLEWVSPSSIIFMGILEFHTKSRSCFGLQSSSYLIAQRFFLPELQINYLRCSCDIPEKRSYYVQEKWFNECMQSALVTIIIIHTIFGNHGVL